MAKRVYIYPTSGMVYTRSHYGFWNFMLDSFMTVCTGGLWLIWIFVREMRKN